MAAGEDCLIVLQMNPPVNITGWTTQFQIAKRLGSTTALVSKYSASGYENGQSGISIINGPQGLFGISIDHPDTSGFEFHPYAYNFQRTDSGSYILLTEGVALVLPAIEAGGL